MKTSKIITAENNIITPKTQKRKIMESSGILVGATAIVPAGFLLADNFSNNKKDYIKSINNEKDVFEKKVQKKVYMDIQKLFAMSGKPITDKELQILTDNSEMQFRTGLEEKLSVLKKLRKSYINRGLKISAGIGISLGVAALAIKNIYEKQKKQSVQVNSTTQTFTNKTISNNNLYFGNKKTQVSFTGIVDKIANELTS